MQPESRAALSRLPKEERLQFLHSVADELCGRDGPWWQIGATQNIHEWQDTFRLSRDALAQAAQALPPVGCPECFFMNIQRQQMNNITRFTQTMFQTHWRIACGPDQCRKYTFSSTPVVEVVTTGGFSTIDLVSTIFSSDQVFFSFDCI
uniref:COMM domain-containing protein 8 isoform X4 n=1 Tax=Myxine glutinosa TaxID=7769 RepID=UPI00358EB478